MVGVSDGSRAIETTFGGLKQQIDADTDVAVGALELMERVTINTTQKYQNIADSARVLDEDIAQFKSTSMSKRHVSSRNYTQLTSR
jgi:uncharacterized protein YdbL (DUF1318 family)